MPKSVDGMPPLRFRDRNFLRNARAALNHWEKGTRGALDPDEILIEFLGKMTSGVHPAEPGKGLENEVRSILLKMKHPLIVRSVAMGFGMSEREAFWLCLGLGMGGKLLIDMFQSGIESMDEAISVN